MAPIVAQPITAAREVAPRDGLAGALGLGVLLPPGPDPLDPEDRWRLGFRVYGPTCGSIQAGTTQPCLPGEGERWPEPDAQDVPRWTAGPPSVPFRVRSGIRCSLTDYAGQEQAWRDEASRLLDLCQWTQVAYELWTGEQAQRDGADNRFLASEDTVVVGTGLSIVDGIARLEDALATCTCGDTNLLHVPRRIVPYLGNKGLISSVTGQTSRIFTHNGSLVIADRGYPGTGPGGSAPDSGGIWLYATSVLSAKIDTPDQTRFPNAQVPGAEAIAYTNEAIVRAERYAAISWLCCHFAAHVAY